MEEIAETDLFLEDDDGWPPAKRPKAYDSTPQNLLQLQRAFLSDGFLTNGVAEPKNSNASLFENVFGSVFQESLRYNADPEEEALELRPHEAIHRAEQVDVLPLVAEHTPASNGLHQKYRGTDPPTRQLAPRSHVRRLFDLDIRTIPVQREPQPEKEVLPVSAPLEIGSIRVFRRPPRTEHIGVQSDGSKFYIRFKKSNWKSDLQNEFASLNVASMTSVLAYRKFRTLVEAARTEMESDKVETVQSGKPETKLPMLAMKTMWVERFRADRYLDLLSDETVNRALLHWLKLWDVTVFHREPKTQNQFKNFGKRKGKNDRTEFIPKSFGGVPDFCFTLDADKRPRFRTALLCGPPGLGKTTLAHVIARHAGYDTLEINASDDRALEVFRNRVESSMMNGNIAALTQNGENANRPKCLIIDEIDGAPTATVEYLVNLLKGEAKRVPKKKGQKKITLWRPIICICNDQYVPALKSLRQVSMVMQFPSVNRERLARRLLEICRILPVQTDSAIIYSLCEKSEDDIRTCLNTIQFASVQGNRITIADVNQSTVGCKDTRKQLFGVWDSIFRTQSTIRRCDPRVGIDHSSSKDAVQNILHIVQKEDLEKVMTGLFENYLVAKHKESRMVLATQCADWLCYADNMERKVMESQSWFLMGYVSFCPVAIHVLLNNTFVPRLNFPAQQFEARQKQARNKETVDAFLKDLTPRVYRTTKSNNLSSELIPFLTSILQPVLKGTNIQLLNQVERVLVREVVDLMTTYGLSYQEERTSNGAVSLVFDPHLEAVSKFWGIPSGFTLSTAAREMIAAQVKLRIIDADAVSVLTGMEMSITEKATIGQDPEPTTALPVSVLTDQPKRSANSAKLQVWSVHDYLRQQSSTQPAARVVQKDSGQKLWYRYKEGFSNAVCRDVKVNRFL